DDREPGNTEAGPRAVALADPRERPHQRHLVTELVGDGGRGLVLALGEEQLLDALCLASSRISFESTRFEQVRFAGPDDSGRVHPLDPIQPDRDRIAGGAAATRATPRP